MASLAFDGNCDDNVAIQAKVLLERSGFSQVTHALHPSTILEIMHLTCSHVTKHNRS